MPKLRFGLRVLLTLPVCVGAFYVGWFSHADQIRVRAERHSTVAKQRGDEIHREISLQRDIRAMKINDSIDLIEHRTRMNAYEHSLQDPIGSRMMPSGAF